MPGYKIPDNNNNVELIIYWLTLQRPSNFLRWPDEPNYLGRHRTDEKEGKGEGRTGTGANAQVIIIKAWEKGNSYCLWRDCLSHVG